MRVSLIIPNWNGEKLLRKNLPLTLAALAGGVEVIVVDDGSTDNSVAVVEEIKKKAKRSGVRIKLLKNQENKGFIFSCNRGVEMAAGEFVVLLNTDVVPQKGFLDAVWPHLQNPKVFAVSFAEQQFGWAKLWWEGGFVHHAVGGRPRRSHISAWASGGSAIFRKSIWQKLGGFDPLYHPFYWEDVDLGYRAWKAGYRIIWEPKAVVEHRHETTIGRFSSSFVNLIRQRNRLLFIWKNITDSALRREHYFALAKRVLCHPGYAKVVAAAFHRYWQMGKPKIFWGKISDRQLLEKLSSK